MGGALDRLSWISCFGTRNGAWGLCPPAACLPTLRGEKRKAKAIRLRLFFRLLRLLLRFVFGVLVGDGRDLDLVLLGVLGLRRGGAALRGRLWLDHRRLALVDPALRA